MRRLIVVFTILTIVVALSGCQGKQAVQEQVQSDNEVAISVDSSKEYDPQTDGIFVTGELVSIDMDKRVVIITNEQGEYTVILREDAGSVFKEFDEFYAGETITIRAEYADDDIRIITGYELIAEEVESNIEVMELKTPNNDVN